MALTYCPVSGASKLCLGFGRGFSWVWVGSESSLASSSSSSDWSRATGEPNNVGGREHCAAMWTKAGFRWADWNCRTTVDSGHPFRPLCERRRRRGANVEEEEEEEEGLGTTTGGSSKHQDVSLSLSLSLSLLFFQF